MDPHRYLPIRGKTETGKSHITRQMLANALAMPDIACERFDFKGTTDVDRDWSGSTRPEDRQGLAIALRELLEAGSSGRSSPRVSDAVCRLGLSGAWRNSAAWRRSARRSDHGRYCCPIFGACSQPRMRRDRYWVCGSAASRPNHSHLEFYLFWIASTRTYCKNR